MNRQHFYKFTNRPFKSCDESIIHLLEVKSKAPSGRTWEKLVLRHDTATGKLPRKIGYAACHWDIRPANFQPLPYSPTKKGLLRPAPLQETRLERKTCFIRWSTGCHIRKQWGGKGQHFYLNSKKYKGAITWHTFFMSIPFNKGIRRKKKCRKGHPNIIYLHCSDRRSIQFRENWAIEVRACNRYKPRTADLQNIFYGSIVCIY
jgi:hypothetical protein